MSLFKCSLCDYNSPLKVNVKKHIENKNIHENAPDIVVIECEIKCEYCHRNFKTKPSLVRHLKICKLKKEDFENKIDEKIKKLENEVRVLKETKHSNMINNNIYFNIQLSAWNDPKIPENIEMYYIEAVKKVFLSIPTLIERLHFNEDIPENHNIFLSNLRSKLAKVFNGKRWEIIDEDSLLDQLIDEYERTLEDWAEENLIYMNYIENYKKIKQRDGHEKVNNDLKTEIKRLIYNNRSLIKNKVN